LKAPRSASADNAAASPAETRKPPHPEHSQAQRLSVVLGAYNGAQFIEAQLQSLVEQTRPADEILIADDGSTDNTEELAKRYANQLPLTFIRNPHNLGAAQNFAALLGHATGDLIALCDQDDIWHPERLEVGEAALADAQALVAFSDGRIVNREGTPLGESLWGSIFFDEAEQQAFGQGKALDVLLRHNVATGATMTLRRSLLQWALPLPAGWIHDAWLALLAAATGQVVAIPQPLIDYRRHEAQQIGTTGASLTRIWRFVRNQTPHALQVEARNHDAIATRLESRAPEAAQRLADKASFLRQRAAHKQSAPFGILSALNAHRRGHYDTFSLGWKSLLADCTPTDPKRRSGRDSEIISQEGDG